MKKTGFVAAISAAVAVLAAAPAIAADVKCAWSTPSSATQIAIANVGVLLKCGMVNVVDPAVELPASYTWTFGDGATETRNIEQTYDGDGNVTTNFRDLSATHAYATGRTATLRVYDGIDGTGNLLGQDSVAVAVSSYSAAQELQISLDNALWYLHTQLAPVGADGISWRDRNYNEGLLMIALAFQKEGYKVTTTAPPASTVTDPYVDDVRRIVKHALDSLRSTANGVYYCSGDELSYGFGLGLQVLSQSGLARNFTTPYGRLSTVIQNMVNWIAWFQLSASGYDWDGGCGITANPAKQICPSKTDSALVSTVGGWPYLREGWGCYADATGLNGFIYSKDDANKGTYGDRSISYWMVSGLDAAETFGATVPLSVRDRLNAFLTANNPCADFSFGPMAGVDNWDLIERAGQGLAMYKWLSKNRNYSSLGLTSNAKVQECRNLINAYWSNHNYRHDQDHPDAYTACSAMSLDGLFPCYSHFKLNAWEFGYWDEFNNWVVTGTSNDINIFAFKTVAEGAKKYTGLLTLPCSNYPGLLKANQDVFGTGAIDDLGWSNGYLFGTAWAVDTLNACR